jgi:alpha-N-acetylglucosaminidase
VVSTDGTHFFTLGGGSGTGPATDAGYRFAVLAEGRYVRVVVLSNMANTSFHLTDTSMYGHPA